jgi:ABC-type Fe3+-hydroxamate transport system substrate-binding protein
MYFPEDPRWIVRTYWNSSYRTIEKIKPDLIILWAQRILDYTQAGAQEKAINLESFQDTYQFYLDADSDQLRDYRLVYRNDVGLFFAREKIFVDFFD